MQKTSPGKFIPRIECVRFVYGGLLARIRPTIYTPYGLPRLDPAYHEEFVKALFKERSDAERSIVEYYSPPSTLCDTLINNGFIIDEKRYAVNGPFVNILAINQE